jgi:hypothetical protein
MLDAGWETISQKLARNGKISSDVLPYYTWIDLLSCDIVACPWIGSQMFENPKSTTSLQAQPVLSTTISQSTMPEFHSEVLACPSYVSVS